MLDRLEEFHNASSKADLSQDDNKILLEIIKQGDIGIFEKFIKTQSTTNGIRITNEMLLVAIKLKNTTLFERLLTVGTLDLESIKKNAYDKANHILLVALKESTVDIIYTLINRPNIMTELGGIHNNAMVLAAIRDEYYFNRHIKNEVLNKLFSVEYLDVEAIEHNSDIMNSWILSWAISLKKVEFVVKFLTIKSVADKVHSYGHRNHVLEHAIHGCSPVIVEKLLEMDSIMKLAYPERNQLFLNAIKSNLLSGLDNLDVIGKLIEFKFLDIESIQSHIDRDHYHFHILLVLIRLKQVDLIEKMLAIKSVNDVIFVNDYIIFMTIKLLGDIDLIEKLMALKHEEISYVKERVYYEKTSSILGAIQLKKLPIIEKLLDKKYIKNIIDKIDKNVVLGAIDLGDVSIIKRLFELTTVRQLLFNKYVRSELISAVIKTEKIEIIAKFLGLLVVEPSFKLGEKGHPFMEEIQLLKQKMQSLTLKELKKEDFCESLIEDTAAYPRM